MAFSALTRISSQLVISTSGSAGSGDSSARGVSETCGSGVSETVTGMGVTGAAVGGGLKLSPLFGAVRE